MAFPTSSLHLPTKIKAADNAAKALNSTLILVSIINGIKVSKISSLALPA
jgi:hypothetical protein